MDDVFKALADPTRRSLLDELFKEDGQTLTTLEGRLPMTRFGVMKHLKVLEEAGLVTTKKRGREKLLEIYIKTSPERLWEAITNSELRAKYNFGMGIESEWTNGSPYKSVHPN